MHFSSLAESLAAAKNPLYILHDKLRADGHEILDLVKGNVNEHGIVYPQEVLRDILRNATEQARVYKPDSLGQMKAREAIASYYDGKIPAEQIVVTPGTSVSYWYCFKLLAEPGDEILTPQPSYPLFEYIARLCGVMTGPICTPSSSPLPTRSDAAASAIESRNVFCASPIVTATETARQR